jgi:hypothetical protein
MIDFLDFVREDQGVELLDKWIPRRRFGGHLRLGHIAEKITEAVSSRMFGNLSNLIFEYLYEATDMKEEAINHLPAVEVLEMFARLVDLNKLQASFPFMESTSSSPINEVLYEYPGRNWALIIHQLASRYGWTRQEIFNLWPEEVFAYWQEIVISSYDEMEQQRQLSEFGYKREYAPDKASYTLKFIPLPRPAWMLPGSEEPETVTMKREMLPIGIVIDHTNYKDLM